MKVISKNLMGALFILFALALLYTSIAGNMKSTPEISLSQLVQKINVGEVKQITISDSDLKVQLNDGTEVGSKKESEAALSETLRNYNVSNDQLQKITIDVQNPSGILYWIGVSLPFLLPFLLVVAFFWMTARQVQRSNVQAFTFGQSRARIID